MSPPSRGNTMAVFFVWRAVRETVGAGVKLSYHCAENNEGIPVGVFQEISGMDLSPFCLFLFIG